MVVCATGYHQADPYAVLGDDRRPLPPRRPGPAPGGARLPRGDRPRACACGIYLQGGTEHTHGITSSLLSNTAIRVGEILELGAARRVAPALVAA